MARSPSKRTGPRRVTISDVAAEAGVARATAAFVINGRAAEMRIARRTSERVREAAGRLGYVPNQIARGMITGRTQVIGVILGGVWGKFGQYAIEGIREVLERRRPGVVVKGKEYEGTANLEERIVESWGGRLVFSSGESFLSSSDLIRRELDSAVRHRPSVPEAYLARHGITREGLAGVVRRFEGARVAVAGDMIVDDYITCDAIGMSREEPTLVVTPVETSRFLGGAGIVAGHAASLGAEVHLLSAVGDDESPVGSAVAPPDCEESAPGAVLDDATVGSEEPAGRTAPKTSPAAAASASSSGITTLGVT